MPTIHQVADNLQQGAVVHKWREVDLPKVLATYIDLVGAYLDLTFHSKVMVSVEGVVDSTIGVVKVACEEEAVNRAFNEWAKVGYREVVPTA